MNLKSNIYIFSVYTTKENERVNYYNHEHTTDQLTKMNVPFKELMGVFNGIEESSVLVEGLEHKDLVERICKLYDQTCYLYSGPDRSSYLVYASGTETYIGTLTSVSQYEAVKEQNYTFDPMNNQYWVTR